MSNSNIPKMIYHYTSIDALINGIIHSEKEVCLWATHCEYLNDPNDSYIGKKLLLENEEIKNIVTDIFPERNELTASYIISFSEMEDSLPMWNMYAKNGNGIILGFSFTDIICDHNYVDYFSHCVYDNTEKYDSFVKYVVKNLNNALKSEYLEEITNKENYLAEKTAFLYGVFHWFSQRIKSKVYEHEKEWRIILPSLKIKNPANFRCQNGLIKPYIKQYFPKESLKEIWIGPCVEMERNYKAISLLLHTYEYSDVIIKKSTIPFKD